MILNVLQHAEYYDKIMQTVIYYLLSNANYSPKENSGFVIVAFAILNMTQDWVPLETVFSTWTKMKRLTVCV